MAKTEKSLLQSDKRCYFTGDTLNLHKHHIMNGAFRNKSEQYGLWIWVRADHHVGTYYAIHNCPEVAKRLKAEAETAFIKKYGYEKYMQEFKKNYLDEEELKELKCF